MHVVTFPAHFNPIVHVVKPLLRLNPVMHVVTFPAHLNPVMHVLKPFK